MLHILTTDWGVGESKAAGGQGGRTTAQTGDATWIHTHDTAMWTNASGDFVAEASAATSVGGLGKYEWSSDQMNADVQAWLDDAATNFGWILIGNENKIKTANRFDTMESSESAWPTLTIEFTP
ncbi:MAG: hypothetical protein FI702_12185 [SAR202 cluster bacterium]|nr:hypothetical protein [SAR202 cluster bacterium]